MSLLTSQQVANIFKMYLGQPVLLWGNNRKNNHSLKAERRPYLLAAVGTETCLPSFGDSLEMYYPMPICPVNQFTLELLPLRSLTNVQAMVIARLLFPEYHRFQFERTLLYIIFDISNHGSHPGNDVRFKINLAAAESDTMPVWFESNYDFSAKVSLVYQYLSSIGYDVPHFIEPGHMSNGKTAVQLGLAAHKRED